jgi:hypothetical protein
MAENFRLAAQHCDALAALPVTGPTYAKLREELGLIEGCCRQAAVWRQDSRWYDIGLQMAEAHKRAGTWLRGYKDPATGLPVKLADAHRKRCFTLLAGNLRKGEKRAVDLRDKATGRVGMILPDAYTLPKRTKAPAMLARNGLILPTAGHA